MLDHERMHTQLKSLARSRKDLFASIVNNYLYAEGPSQVVAEVDWYDNQGTHALSKLPLLSKTNRDPKNFNRLTFVRECYPQPLALWPNDPLDKLEPDDPTKYYFRVIDRNETSA